MIRIDQIKLNPDHSSEDLYDKLCRTLRLKNKTELLSWEILRKSVDARKKPEISLVYSVLASVRDEEEILRRCRKNADVRKTEPADCPFENVVPAKHVSDLRPVIAGCGPAGMFCALILAEHGLKPLVIERGDPVEVRTKRVETFWEKGILDPQSNVQFGEGGAGTFSDGKLNTMIKDPCGRIRFVLQTFVRMGADPDILTSYKPHIGTDALTRVIRNLREEIISLGGEFLFRHRLEDLDILENGILRLKICKGSGPDEEKEIQMETPTLVLAVGHSARDTFSMLYSRKLAMQPKAFAAGVRIQHPQRWIDLAMYGEKWAGALSPAPYKLTARTRDNKGVYSFCMCPGGYVVNASSEEGGLAVNGMSYHDRAGSNANSAIVVTVAPPDHADVFWGIRLQRELEEKAYQTGMGKIPVQRFEDFCLDRKSEGAGIILPFMKGGFQYANVRSIFPDQMALDLEEGIRTFDRSIPGFAHPDSLLCGVESRTSSPLRILRDDTCLSSVSCQGIYPCGEGAGYAGGITSAAVDGLKVAGRIVEKELSGR